METLKIVVTVIHVLIAFGLMVTVLFQSGKSQGLSGSIAGGAETFFGKNKGKTMDGILAKVTVALAILFVVTSVSLSLISKKIQSDADAAINSQPGQETEVIEGTTEDSGDVVTEGEVAEGEVTEEATGETAE